MGEDGAREPQLLAALASSGPKRLRKDTHDMNRRNERYVDPAKVRMHVQSPGTNECTHTRGQNHVYARARCHPPQIKRSPNPEVHGSKTRGLQRVRETR